MKGRGVARIRGTNTRSVTGKLAYVMISSLVLGLANMKEAHHDQRQYNTFYYFRQSVSNIWGGFFCSVLWSFVLFCFWFLVLP